MRAQIFSKKTLLFVIIAFVISVSWFGTLDEYSDNYIDDSIIEAGSAYAIARGINGIVSVLQTSTIEAGVGLSGSIEIGEVLDPVNDLIERFSNVMSLALGSLVLQKILLVISEHYIFNSLMIAFGLILSVALLLGKQSVVTLTSRIFAILVFVRFSLVLVVALNSVVDSIFISEQITTGAEELNQFKTDVARIEAAESISDDDLSVYKEEIRGDNLKIDEINSSVLPSLNAELSGERKQLSVGVEDLDTAKESAGWLARLNPLEKDRNIIHAKRRVEKHKQKIIALEKSIEAKTRMVKQLQHEIESSEKRISGEPVGAWETIKSKIPSISGLKKSLNPNMIGENITNDVGNIINLAMLFILKTILIPLGFFYVLIKVMKVIWNGGLNYFQFDNKKPG